MTDVLSDNSLAAAMWLETLERGGSPVAMHQDYYQGDYDCPSGTTFHYIDQLYLGAITQVTAALIAVDTVHNLAYFHLTGMAMTARRTNYSPVCNVQIGVPPFPNIFTPYVTKGADSDIEIGIDDGGSDTAPYDGHTILPHSGFPVVAAAGDGTGIWYPLKAGDATDATQAACEAALWPSGVPTIGGTDTEDDINITIEVRS